MAGRRLVRAALGVRCPVSRGLLFVEAAGAYGGAGNAAMQRVCEGAAEGILCGDCQGLPGCLFRQAEARGQRRLPLSDDLPAISLSAGGGGQP